jgi:hypothetical protein
MIGHHEPVSVLSRKKYAVVTLFQALDVAFSLAGFTSVSLNDEVPQVD